MTRRLIRLLTARPAPPPLVLTALPAQAMPMEDYASYQPQTGCSPKAKPGTKQLSRWIVNHFERRLRPDLARPARPVATSEHKEGRAFDWTLDATTEGGPSARRRDPGADLPRPQGRRGARPRAPDGVMYIIWNDHMYRACDRFENARLPQLELPTTKAGCSRRCGTATTCTSR